MLRMNNWENGGMADAAVLGAVVLGRESSSLSSPTNRFITYMCTT